MSICEEVGNNVWDVSLHGGGHRTVIGKSHRVDSDGNLVFAAFLPCGCCTDTATFAPGTWVQVQLARPQLVAFDGVIGS
jgi:hypothetical protein